MPHSPILAYVSCRYAKGNRGTASWGALVVAGEQPELRLGGADASTTGHAMALSAALEVASAFPLDCRGTLHIDHGYVAEGVNRWRPTWEERRWCNSTGGIIANFPLWRDLFAVLDVRPLVAVEWVRGAEHYEPMAVARQLAAEQMKLIRRQENSTTEARDHIAPTAINLG